MSYHLYQPTSCFGATLTTNKFQHHYDGLNDLCLYKWLAKQHHKPTVGTSFNVKTTLYFYFMASNVCVSPTMPIKNKMHHF